MSRVVFVIFLAYNFYPKRLNCPLVATSIRSSSSIRENKKDFLYMDGKFRVRSVQNIKCVPNTPRYGPFAEKIGADVQKQQGLHVPSFH